MAFFKFIAKDAQGKSVKGDLEASSKQQALEVLRNRKLMVLKLNEAKQKSDVLAMLQKKKVSMDDLVVFFRQLATMIDAGLPIVMSLDILMEQSENPQLRETLKDVRDSVNTGSNLSDAMMKHPKEFSNLFINMVRAGESSGTLDVILDRIATYIEKTTTLQKKIKSAMIYPAVVSGMALVITMVLILKVIPVFTSIYVDFGAKLPGPTQFLVSLSDFLRHYFWLIVVVTVGAIMSGRWYANTPGGRVLLDGYKLKLPVFGSLLTKVAISKFSRTLSTLVKSGVPILSALEIVAKTSGNLVIENAVNDVRDHVRDGETIASQLEMCGIFPSMVTRMVSVGEKSGQLEKMLSKISDFYDSQVDVAVDGLTSMIEPFIIAFLGVVVGGIVLCMFLPIFKISEVVSMGLIFS